MNSENIMTDLEAIQNDLYPKTTLEGSYITAENTVEGLRGVVSADEETEVTVCNKNINNEINQYYFLNTATTEAGRWSGNQGLVIQNQNFDYITISAISTQEKFRAGCIEEIIEKVGDTSLNKTVYNGKNADGGTELTINCEGYKYIVINVTDLTQVQVELGNVATEYIKHKSKTYTVSDKTEIRTYDDITHIYNTDDVNMTVEVRERKE